MTVEKLETPVAIYNFEVEDWHTYYVADSGVLVHNMCAVQNTMPASAGTTGGAGKTRVVKQLDHMHIWKMDQM